MSVRHLGLAALTHLLWRGHVEVRDAGVDRAAEQAETRAPLLDSNSKARVITVSDLEADGILPVPSAWRAKPRIESGNSSVHARKRRQATLATERAVGPAIPVAPRTRGPTTRSPTGGSHCQRFVRGHPAPTAVRRTNPPCIAMTIAYRSSRGLASEASYLANLIDGPRG